MNHQKRRTPSMFAARLMLASALVAAGTLSCQIISGLNDLEPRDPPDSGSGGGSGTGVVLVCDPGQTQDCYSGPTETKDVGVCVGGTQTCEADGSAWGTCMGEVTPQAGPENCADGSDITCDGTAAPVCTGTPIQAFSFGGSTSEIGHTVAVDSQGNAILVGSFNGMITLGIETFTSSDGGYDGFIVKLNPSGVALWAQSFGGPGYDAPISVVVDKDDSIVLTGAFTTSMTFGKYTLTGNGEEDIFVAKLGANGDPMWAQGFGGTGIERGTGVAVDEMGSVFLTGHRTGAFAFGASGVGQVTIGEDGFVAKLTPDGQPSWIVGFGGSGDENGFGITLDSDGNVVAVGRASGDVLIGQVTLYGKGGNCAFICKLKSDDGAYIWADVFGPTTMMPKQLAYDVARGGDDGEVVIAGHFEGAIEFPPNDPIPAIGSLDLFIAKLDRDGKAIWSLGNGGADIDAVFELDVDRFGNAVIVGQFSPSLTFGKKTLTSKGLTDGFIVKFTPEGTLLWAQALGSDGNDIVYGVAMDAAGAPFIAGKIEGNTDISGLMLTHAGAGDAFFAKFDP
jgi:hypothetical protein